MEDAELLYVSTTWPIASINFTREPDGIIYFQCVAIQTRPPASMVLSSDWARRLTAALIVLFVMELMREVFRRTLVRYYA